MRAMTFIGFLAGIATAWWLCHLEKPKCDGAVTYFIAEQVAREGRTDKAFYRQHPDHFAAGGISTFPKTRP